MKIRNQNHLLTSLALILVAVPASAQNVKLVTGMSMPMDKSMPAKAKSPFANEMNQGMAKMNKAMMGAQMTGNPDHDFAAMMIPHHAGAIAMAQTELKYGKDPVLRKLASQIIVAQNKEIALMKSRLAAMKTTKGH